MARVPLSVLDLVPIREGGDAGEALRASIALIQRIEQLGYRRYWVAEHHNMPGIASAATSLVIAMLAQATKRIRVGAGGIMLPNHAPLVVAEQFGTLDALFPGRIDLGLGRAPGTDGATAIALRRDPDRADAFPDEVRELQSLLGPSRPGQRIKAVPGAGSSVPLWILGSSLFGAELAAAYGLPYAFASHFAPAALADAVALYRRKFVPSEVQPEPHVMLGVNVLAAPSEAEARRRFTSVQQMFANMLRGRPSALPPPIDDIETYWSPFERARAREMLRLAIVGEPPLVRDRLQQFAEAHGADELIVVSTAFDPEHRAESFELIAAGMAD